MKRILVVVCILSIFSSLVAGCAQTQEPSSETVMPEESQAVSEEPTQQLETSLKIGVIYLTAEHPYYQAHAKHTEDYAKELGIELIELDGQLDQANMASQMENLIAQQVDGIVYCLLEPAAASQDILDAQAAGIPVVTFAIKHDPEVASCPFVGLDEKDAGALGGVAAANIFKESFPDQMAKIAVIEVPGQSASENRSDGFLEGFLSIIPDAELVERVNGGGVKDQSMSVVEDILQTHPELNVFYGANGDQGLGALAALESMGRGTIETEIVISHDGSEPEIINVVDPNSALKIAVGNRPKELARQTIDALLEIINGDREITNADDIYVAAAVITGDDLEFAQQFLTDEYCSTTVLE